MNLRGLSTLLYKEILRFAKVWLQTVMAPVIMVLLYLVVFSHVLSQRVEVYAGIPYSAFLIPGLMMMTVIQNAFANSSSSLIQSKVTGNLVFVLLTLLSYLEFFMAYVLAAVVRGLLVGTGVLVVAHVFVGLPVHSPWVLVGFGFLGSATLGALGVIAGIWAEKFDQLAAFQNFVIMPLSFLSGVFYSIHSLPALWRATSHFNPFLYMIDGFRYGFFGVSDIPVATSFAVVAASLAGVSALALMVLKTGYKLRD